MHREADREHHGYIGNGCARLRFTFRAADDFRISASLGHRGYRGIWGNWTAFLAVFGVDRSIPTRMDCVITWVLVLIGHPFSSCLLASKRSFTRSADVPAVTLEGCRQLFLRQTVLVGNVCRPRRYVAWHRNSNSTWGA